jgi:hypothetical protein
MRVPTPTTERSEEMAWAYRDFDADTWEVYDTANQKRCAYVGDEEVAQALVAAMNERRQGAHECAFSVVVCWIREKVGRPPKDCWSGSLVMCPTCKKVAEVKVDG